jgi:hypothetical protein
MTEIVPIVKTPLDTLADEIKAEHQQVAQALGNALLHAREAGAKLIHLKTVLKQERLKDKTLPKFLEWVRVHCEVGERMAQNYMRIAENWNLIEEKLRLVEKRNAVTGMSVRQALTFLRRDEKPHQAPTRQRGKRRFTLTKSEVGEKLKALKIDLTAARLMKLLEALGLPVDIK